MIDKKAQKDSGAIHKALELEETEPKAALDLYQQASKENRERYWDVLLIAIICPVAASIIVFLIIHPAEHFRTLNVFLIMSIFGYGPALWLYERRQADARFRYFGFQYMRLYRLPAERYDSLRRRYGRVRLAFSLALIFIGTTTTLIMIVFFSAFFILPVAAIFCLILRKSPENLPFSLLLTINVLGSIFGVAFGFSLIGAPLFPLKGFLSGMIVDVKLSIRDILDFLAGVGMGLLIVGAGPLGLLYNHLYEGMIASAFTGALLGLSLYDPETDFILALIIQLGQIRCFLRLKRKDEARYWINDILRRPDLSFPRAIRDLASILSAIEGRGKEQKWDFVPLLEELSTEAREGMSLDKPYQEIWLSSVLKTYSLTKLGVAGRQSNGELQVD